MPMKPTDRLILRSGEPQRSTLNDTSAEILRHSPFHPGDVLLFLVTLFDLCELNRRDFAIYSALAVNESDWFRYVWWKLRLNPAAIGITGDTVRDQQSPTFASGADAAQVFFLLLEIKIQRGIPFELSHLTELAPEKILETAAFALFEDFPDVLTLNDLHARFGARGRECVWACNPANAAAVIIKSRELWPALANQTTEGNEMTNLTPYPPMQDKPLPDKFGAGMTWMARWMADEKAAGTFTHSMFGWLWSTDAYFRLSSIESATDYGIGGQGDGASDGVIFRWINYHERRNTAGWASGWSVAPDYTQKGRDYVNTFGHSAINGYGRSIELSGLVATPISAKQWTSYIHLMAAIHHRELKQGFEEFKWNLEHADVAEKDCAFPRYRNFAAQAKAGILQTMKHYETGADIPDSMVINGKTVLLPGGQDGGIITPAPAGPIMVAFAKPLIVETMPGALSRQWGDRNSNMVRMYQDRTKLRLVGYYHGDNVNGEDRWFVIKSPGPSNNARIHKSGIRGKITDRGMLE